MRKPPSHSLQLLFHFPVLVAVTLYFMHWNSANKVRISMNASKFKPIVIRYR